ncbi:Spermidine/putrescine import ATP-binding protein PotA [Aquisphaera giovannonii]|uniref:Spermidine/putrescine import ATP-binding protein PotA n=1 Tax=Aquisphaera giovannonii TaxID=406548 RepID=A0A5B9W0N6_9BACT|nr:ABC transporter ATP-binding protein [Aquisphaera giovannonii]QEH33470.1 Spermidine/putrescine import ATP-binding protein PotA [Aquisphaera giovannonii]
MIRLTVDGLVKRFGQVAAVDGASLEVAPGELCAVVGPPGAGKSTLSRLLAGLETPDDGEVFFDDRMVQSTPPRERGVGVVFPDFALWPTMTVAENVAYPLAIRRVKAPERRRRLAETLSMLRIDSLAGKRPEQLSPAQAFRVALARAVVAGPDLLILDEPLDPFDSRGKAEVLAEIRTVREEVGITAILLTRSVAEALAACDRVAVMDLGRILQAGPPDDVYNGPVDAFVARFLGPTNLLQGQIDGNGAGPDGRRELVVRTPLGRLVATMPGPALAVPLPPGTPVTLSIRPETLAFGPTIPADWNRFPATIERMSFQGETRLIELRGPGDWPITAKALQSRSRALREGQSLTLSVAPEFVTLLPGRLGNA